MECFSDIATNVNSIHIICVYTYVHTCIYLCVHMCDNSDNATEMQPYIDILPYRDTLGGDNVSIHIKLYRYVEYHDISMYHSVSTFRLYTYTYSICDRA